ncbi:hypothetical protein [uncultured Parabacteroides sp.]|jgi:hypothetical protein|uniref:hypothetical protein n=1 Tax=uncultured Parabacteroides sp. TaxID=512312 RepID=UPI0025DD6FE5|nr:hypothetical protein [uncultured Parabacteroides sp.]
MNIIKYILLAGLSVCLFTSCGATLSNAIAADNNIQKVELGMSKLEIIHIMGNTYKRLEVKQTHQGYRETLGYSDMQDGLYRFRLLNDKLQEWDYLQPSKCKDHCSDK